MKKIPNFFIVGAPRCGTTALCTYLKRHPQIFVSDPKEPHYFADDLPFHRKIRTQNDYLDLFKSASDTHSALGEASVLYLYSTVAAKNIHEFNKDAKIIVMLRNPIDFIYSYYSMGYFLCYEDVKDFRKAWDLQEDRSKGRNIPAGCHQPELLQYAAIGKTGMQLQRLNGIFPARQVKVILFDDFVSDTESVYEEILEFLGVSSMPGVEFMTVHPNKINRSENIARFIKRPGPVIRIPFRLLKNMGISFDWLRNRINALNAREAERNPLDTSMKKQLSDVFSDDIELLSRILSRDLSHWLY